MAHEPDNDCRRKDNRESLLDEVFRLIPQVQHKVFGLRHVVCGQFHNERGNVAFHRGRSHKKHASDCDDYAQNVHTISNYVGIFKPRHSCDTARDCRKNRQFCATTEKRNNPDCRDAFLFVGKRTGVDERGNGAPESHNHRHERPARKTESSENSVKDERYARHISAVFQNREEQEQQKNLRQEAEHREQAAEDTVNDKPRKPVGCARFHKTFVDAGA